MQRNKRDVEASLRKKGFVQDERHHHYFIYQTLDGRKTTVRTRTSHSGKELGVQLLKLMARQCCLDRDQFQQLVDCPLSREQYETLLDDLGEL
ncbi:MAG: type II toxin-antitoxin system HicA family toxin [Bacteroidota bacterium]